MSLAQQIEALREGLVAFRKEMLIANTDKAAVGFPGGALQQIAGDFHTLTTSITDALSNLTVRGLRVTVGGVPIDIELKPISPAVG